MSVCMYVYKGNVKCTLLQCFVCFVLLMPRVPVQETYFVKKTFLQIIVTSTIKSNTSEQMFDMFLGCLPNNFSKVFFIFIYQNIHLVSLTLKCRKVEAKFKTTIFFGMTTTTAAIL